MLRYLTVIRKQAMGPVLAGSMALGASDAQAWDWRPPEGEPVLSLHFIDRLPQRWALLVLAGLRQGVAGAPAGVDLTGLDHGITYLDFILFDSNRDPALASLRELGLLVTLHRFGEGGPEHAGALMGLAGSYGFYPRDWTAAEAPARQAVAIFRQNADQLWHNQLPNALDLLAYILSAVGKHDEAADLRREVLEYWQAQPDIDPAVIQPRMLSLVDELYLAEQTDEAEVLIETWLVLEYAQRGIAPPAPVGPLLAEADERASGDVADRRRAEALRDDAVAILEGTLAFLARHDAPYHTPYWMTRLADVLVMKGQISRATELQLEALALRQTRMGDGHPATRGQVRRTLAHLRQHDPDHPQRPALEAVAAQDPHRQPDLP